MATELSASAALAALASSHWTAVREAVERIADMIRAGALEPSSTEQFGMKLAALATHPKWEVRKAVAEALQYLRHEKYYAVLVRLADDDHAFVCDAARLSLARRSALLHGDALAEQRGDLLERWLDEIGTAHGPAARAQALRIAEKYAERMVREAKHEIVRVIAPLDAALGSLNRELEKKRVGRKSSRAHLTRARDRARLLNGIVTSLVDYTTNVTPQFHEENLRELIEEAVSIAKHNTKNRRTEADVTCSDDLQLIADRHRLLQALSNIIQNAIEAYPAKARATVEIVARLTDTREEVVLRIADAGCGMSDEARLDAVRLYSTSKPGGTGFGLPLAKKIIETEHRGGLGLVSTKGEGTTVTVVLPLEQT